MQVYHDTQFDQERALYGLNGVAVRHCAFDGPADGESALKECRNVVVEDSLLALRYPLWHVQGGHIARCRMTTGCRAALWYSSGLHLTDCAMEGIKAVRECTDTTLTGCDIHSPEFGWQCTGLHMQDCSLVSEYPFLHSANMDIEGLRMQGKYSFQYVENVTLRGCYLKTKDAFWHSKNVTVYDSVIEGEYLAWYAENLKLVRCRLVGTQPLCYDKGLVLEDCTMEGADLAFENSEVTATVQGQIDSVKNPVSGSICAGSIGQVILDEHLWPGADCCIRTAGAQTAMA